MEEILASIRRIIADDEAKPAVAEKATAPAASAKPERPDAAAGRLAAMNGIPPSAIPTAQAAAARPAAAPAHPVKPAGVAAAPNSQDDIDAAVGSR